jgi:hypothetical protein
LLSTSQEHGYKPKKLSAGAGILGIWGPALFLLGSKCSKSVKKSKLYELSGSRAIVIMQNRRKNDTRRTSGQGEFLDFRIWSAYERQERNKALTFAYFVSRQSMKKNNRKNLIGKNRNLQRTDRKQSQKVRSLSITSGDDANGAIPHILCVKTEYEEKEQEEFDWKK